MAEYKLQLFKDWLGANNKHPLVLLKKDRVLYVRDGISHVKPGNQKTAETLSHNSAWFGAEKIILNAGSNGASVFRFRLSKKTKKGQCCKKRKASSRLLQEKSITLKPRENYLLRCNRVDIPPVGTEFMHTHKGPGIRYLLNGGFTVETAGKKSISCSGQSWFEAGSGPVLAFSPEHKPGHFCRVMVLPRSLLGENSITYVKPEDKEKPKLQGYATFIDEHITK